MEQNEKVQIPCWNVCTHLRNSIPEKEQQLKTERESIRKRPPSSQITHRVGEWTQWGDKRSKSFVAAITAEKGKETLLSPVTQDT